MDSSCAKVAPRVACSCCEPLVPAGPLVVAAAKSTATIMCLAADVDVAPVASPKARRFT